MRLTLLPDIWTIFKILIMFILTIWLVKYESCSNMNESSFITFFTYMLRQNDKRFYKGLYVTFKLEPDLKKIRYTYQVIAL